MSLPPERHARPPGYSKERAAYWAVDIRVMQNWLAAKVPVHDDAEMKQWYASLAPDVQAKLTPSFRQKILGGEKRESSGDADYKAFEAGYSAEGNDQTVLADLKKQLAFWMFKHRATSEGGDSAGASEAMRQIKELASVVHDSELRAQKLGRDMGDLVPREQLETPARFIGYHLVRCADAALKQIAKAITERDPALPVITAKEIEAIGEPILLTALVFQPMVRAMESDNGAAPPDWLLAALKEGMAEVVE